MYNFKVYRWKDKTYINEKFEYKTGEILGSYLNLNLRSFEKKHLEFKKKRLEIKAKYPVNELKGDYNESVWAAQKHFDFVDGFAKKLMPFKEIVNDFHANRLIKLLNEYRLLFEYDDDEEVDAGLDFSEQEYGEYLDADTEIDFKDEDDEEFPNKKMKSRYIEVHSHRDDKELIVFEPSEFAQRDGEDIAELNAKIEYLFDEYNRFAEDILRVKYVYSDFLDNYFHLGNAFPNPHETAEAYEKYVLEMKKDKMRTIYERFVPTKSAFSNYGVLRIVENKRELPLLCEMIEYRDIGSFLNYELFDGIKTGNLPKRCGNCGRYFLPGSAYADFCERISPGEKYKTCRDVGAKKKFDEKVKSDPIWLTYQRAYKTHYARYMKKKMTISEFEKWSAMAIELRAKALAKEIAFDEYERLIRE